MSATGATLDLILTHTRWRAQKPRFQAALARRRTAQTAPPTTVIFSLPIRCPVHCLFTAYSLPIHGPFPAHSLPIPCLFPAYYLHITALSLPIHCLFPALSLPFGAVEQALSELGLPFVDSLLLHGPAVGETAILLHPPPPSVGASIGM